MDFLRSLRATLHRLRGIFHRRSLEHEMQAEMQAHLDVLTERNVAAGMPPEDARYAALRAFGGVAQIAERARDERRSVWVEQLWQDLRYATRSLAKSPSFTITAVLTLALGIGVNAALFSLYNRVALRPLPVKDPSSLVRIAGRNSVGSQIDGFGHAEYLAYRHGSHTLDGLLAFNEARWPFQPESGAKPVFDVRGVETVPIELVSENYFSMLGGRMQLGRDFLPEEVRTSAAVIVVSHLFWESHLHRDPNVIGTTVRLGRHLLTVIGVATAEFSGHRPTPPAGWLPLTLWSNQPADYGPRGPLAFALIGRLKPGITEAQAKADLDVIASTRAVEFPGEKAKLAVRFNRQLRFVNIPPTLQNLARLSPLILGFGMVLVIACTNVANLLIARGVSRQSEIGVRLTLGASRGRIIRQLLTENVLLCLLGAVVGLALGIWTLQLILPIILSPYMPPAWLMFLRPTPDLRVLGFTALLTVGASLVAGLLPALHTARASLIAAVHNDGTTFGRRLTPSRLRQLLVIVQVAVCLTLLSCAGVLARNFFAPQKVDRGYDADAVFEVGLTPNTAITDRVAAFRQALETLRTVPGVTASGAMNPPVFEVFNGIPTRIRAVETAARGAEEQVPAAFMTERFMDTFGVQLLRGRTFLELEQHSASRAIIVSESLARRLWPGQEAVGKTLAINEAPWNWGSRPLGFPEERFRDCEVIGVSKDIMLQFGDSNPRQVYLPFPLDIPSYAAVFIRPYSDSGAALAEIVRAAESQGIGLQFRGPLSSRFKQTEVMIYGFAVLSGALGALALAMASVGLYGVMAFAVNQRVREIGIRIALGATAEKVVKLFVRQGMKLVTIGLTLGLLGGWLFALVLEKILFGLINSFDPVAFGAVTLLFALIALFACWLPARRATKVDPVVALRAE